MSDASTAVKEAREQLRQINELIKTNQERRHAAQVEAQAREDDIALLSSRRDSWEQLLKDAEAGAGKADEKDDTKSSDSSDDKPKAAAKKTAAKKASSDK
jgi:hypothetical protein